MNLVSWSKKTLMPVVLFWAVFALGADFIHGIYGVRVNENDTAMVKKLGFNYTHCYLNPYTEEGYNLAKKQLDLAEKYGLKVNFDLGTKVLIGKENAVAELIRIVRDFKNHPALGSWYLYDEPSTKQQQADLRLFYSILKRETPEIPVLLCLSQNEQWKNFIEPCDILMGDIYPVKDEPFPESPLHYFTNFMRQMSKYNKPFIPIPQLMCWTTYPEAVKNFDYNKLRYPNETELRCFFYAPLAMGNMRGTFWYSFFDIFYYGHKNGKKNEDFKKIIAPLIHEFNDFISLLKEPTNAKVFRWAEDNQFQLALFEGVNGKQFVVLVNLWPIKRRFDRWAERIITDNVNLKPWRFTRNVKAKVENGKFVLENDWVYPWETMIWEIERNEK